MNNPITAHPDVAPVAAGDPEARSGPTPAPPFLSPTLRPDALALGIVISMTLMFMLFIYDRFVPFQEGWFHYYAMLMNRGEVPYRDFYFHTQPIPLFVSRALISVEDGFMVFRYAGMAERALLASLVYFYIRQFASTTASLLGTIGCVSIYQVCLHDPLYSYLQTTLLFTIISLIFLQKWVAGGRERPSWLFLAGLAVSLSFFVKQSSGLFMSFIEFVLIFLAADRLRSAPRDLAAYLAGWAVPAGLLALWLSSNGAFVPYIDCVFGGVSSKGSTTNILFGFIRRMATDRGTIIIAVLSLVGCAVLYPGGSLRRALFGKPGVGGPEGSGRAVAKFHLLLLGGLFLSSSMVPYLASSRAKELIWKLGYDPYNHSWMNVIFLGFALTSVAMIAERVVDRISGRRRAPAAMLVPTVASATWMYTLGLSLHIDENAMVPALGLAVAYAYDRAIGRPGVAIRAILIGFALWANFTSTTQRLNNVYHWWGWDYGSIFASTKASSLPQLKGFRLDPATVAFYEKMTRIIDERSKPGDPIYSFPISLLPNYLAGRKQATFSPVAYFDVCPDFIAIRDAERLRRHPPKVLVYMDMPAIVWEIHETQFRDERRSGQREIDEVLRRLIASGDYECLERVVTPDPFGWETTVWARRDPDRSKSVVGIEDTQR